MRAIARRTFSVTFVTDYRPRYRETTHVLSLVPNFTSLKGNIMNAMRMVFLTVAMLLSLGIYLTGVNNVHWLLYVPTVMLAFAALTGICPGLIFWSMLGFKNEHFCQSKHAN